MAKFSRVLGREILHLKEISEQIQRRHLSYGMLQSHAELLVWLEDITAKGGLEKYTRDAVERPVTGRDAILSIKVYTDAFSEWLCLVDPFAVRHATFHFHTQEAQRRRC